MKVKAKYWVRYNGKRYKAGDVFECDDKGLLIIGAVEKVVTEKAKPPVSDSELKPEFDAAAVKAKLVEWLDTDPDQKDETKWNKSGTPSNSALDKEFGFDLKAADVKPVWDALMTEREAAQGDAE